MIRKCLFGAALALALSSAAPTDEPLSVAAGANEDTRVDVRLVPVPLESRYRGNVSAIVVFSDPASVDRLCGTLPGMRVIACVNEIGGSVIVAPNPCNVEFQGEDYASVLCHEKGHVLGWHHQDPSFTRQTREG